VALAAQARAGRRKMKNEQNKTDNNILPQLFQNHIEKLTNKHGLNVETIEEAGLFSATAPTLNHILNRNDVTCGGFVISYNEGFRRAKLDRFLEEGGEK
jgi:hypothetical protein